MPTAPFLADYAQRMVLYGNAVYMIDVDFGLALIPASGFKVRGSYQPSSWTYQLTLPRPTGEPAKRLVPAAGVVHVLSGATSSSPWRGRSPLERAGLTAGQLANIEKSLGLDSSVPTGGILPQPDAATPMAVKQAQTALSQGKGGLTLVETTAAGWGQGQTAAPRQDWEQKRFGPMPPAPNIALRDSASNAVLAALGASTKLWNGDGASMRESYRLLVANTAQSLAALLEREIGVKLEVPVAFDLSPAGSLDPRGLGRAVGSLVAAGMPLDEAKGIAGLGGRLA